MSRRFTPRALAARARRAAVVVVTAAAVALPATALVTGTTTTASSAQSPVTTYTPSPPQLAEITDGTAQAPWNASQGDPGFASYTSQAPGTVYPTYTPGGAEADGEPNLPVYPGSSSGATDGNTPYPSGVVGTPGPLAGYCGTGNNATASNGSPVRQPYGTTLPLAPAYFPHIVRNADGSLTGYFDYRPKDTDEAIVAATSKDNGKTWTYDAEALEQNPGYCPTADVNDDGEGHPNVLGVGGTSRLYTLQRPAGDNIGVGMLVHTLDPTPTNPLAGVPGTEQVGIDPDAFATNTEQLPVPYVDATPPPTPAVIPLTQTGEVGSPEQLVAGAFVDLTATAVPNASTVIDCTGVTTSAPFELTGCTTTDPSGIDVNDDDLIEQVIGTVGTNSDVSSNPASIPPGPNGSTGDLGASVGVNFATQTTAYLFNANAPNRAYVNGVAVYCNQADANPTDEMENCTTGPGGPTLPLAAGAVVTSDPIIPATATQTSGLIAPDGIVGELPSYPESNSSLVPSGATFFMYTEKILNYYVAGTGTAKGTFGKAGSTASFSIPFTPSQSELGSAGVPSDLPSTISTASPVSIFVGDTTANGGNGTIAELSCTGLTTGTTDTLMGCTLPNVAENAGVAYGDSYNKNSLIGAPGAAIVPATTLALTGEGSGINPSAKNIAKLDKNNEDLTVLRVAWTTDGVNFSDAGLANAGVISGASDGAPSYSDINDPSSQVSPSNLNEYATPGTADATELRWVGSAGSIITNPNGTYGMFLSGAWAADGDSDAFNQIFYSSSSDGENWSIPTMVVSTDYTFSASVAQDNALANGDDDPLGISAYYSGRAYGPSVVQNPNGTLTMVFAGYRLPKPIEDAGTVLGTNPAAQYTIGASDPALYRNILVETLTTATSPVVTTATTLATSDATPVVGEPVTYTATVAPVSPGTGTPTGTVTFTGGAGPLCTTALDGSVTDQATCTTTYGAPGSDSVTATYNGDANYATSSGGPEGETIGPDTTTTGLVASPADPVAGEEVTFTATVAPAGLGAGTPTGTVTVAGDAGQLCTAALDEQAPDEATCSAPEPLAGTDSVTASYGGDINDLPSTSSPPTAVVVAQSPTTTSLATSDPTPVVGEPVTYTATVAPAGGGAGTPTGSVTFADGAGTLCTSTLDEAAGDEASCVTSYVAPGTDAVTASYGGDGNFLTSTSAVQGEAIGQAATSTTLGAEPTSPVVGETVTYTATVAPVAPGAGTPTGTVAFAGDGGTLCSAAELTGGQATCSTSYANTDGDAVIATYGGDGNFTGSSSSTVAVTVQPASTSTSLGVDDAAPVVGQPVTYTATVSVVGPGDTTPSGTVTFTGAAGVLCTSPLDAASGQASCATSYPASGGDSVTATYNGDANDASSTSSSVTVAIGPAATTTALAATTRTAKVGQSVTFTATVAVSAPGSGSLTGDVTFASGATTLCTSPVGGSGEATCDVAFPATGSTAVTATYGGDANFTGSASSAVSEQVSASATTTALAASVTTSVVGEQVTFTATVSPVAPGAGVPSGAVSFKSGATTRCVADLDDTTPDQATCTAAATTLAALSVRATYAGTAAYLGSSSNTVSVPVTAADTVTSLSATPSPSVTGERVVLTATVAAAAPGGGTPTGHVLFSVETASDASLNCLNGDSHLLAHGTASCVLTGADLSAAQSPLSILAAYEGSAEYQPSQASTGQVVDVAPTTVTLHASANPSAAGAAVSFTATARAVAPGSGLPAGQVAFSFPPGSSLACTGGDTVTLTSGATATCMIARHELESSLTVRASYLGSTRYGTSAATLDQTVS